MNRMENVSNRDSILLFAEADLYKEQSDLGHECASGEGVADSPRKEAPFAVRG